jgi:hypothetical protein
MVDEIPLKLRKKFYFSCSSGELRYYIKGFRRRATGIRKTNSNT